MKTIIPVILICLFFSSVQQTKAQDTIYKKNKEILIGKVQEISPTEIKYKAWNNLDGPVIVIYASDVFKIRYQNGVENVITPDPYALNQENQIINKVQAVKFSFFSPLNYTLCFGYERMLKVGTNLEAKIAYIGAGYKPMNDYNATGSYAKIGVKFLLGQDFYINGLRYIHPFKGRYIKVEFAYSYFVVKDVEFYYSTSTNYYNNMKGKTNVNVSAGAVNIIYGRQFILGNMFTLDYFVGIGYGVANTKYSNDNYTKNSYLSDYGFSSNCYAFTYQNSRMPLTFTGGMTIGYIF